jgi:hypothetical protein
VRPVIVHRPSEASVERVVSNAHVALRQCHIEFCSLGLRKPAIEAACSHAIADARQLSRRALGR